MLSLENQVCSLELSRRLKELGVEYEAYFNYIFLPNKDIWEIYPLKNQLGFPAYTASELGEILPAYANVSGDSCMLYLSKYRIPVVELEGQIRYSCEYWKLEDSHYFLGKGYYDINEANVRAKMLIYLIENELMEINIT